MQDSNLAALLCVLAIAGSAVHDCCIDCVYHLPTALEQLHWQINLQSVGEAHRVRDMLSHVAHHRQTVLQQPQSHERACVSANFFSAWHGFWQHLMCKSRLLHAELTGPHKPVQANVRYLTCDADSVRRHSRGSQQPPSVAVKPRHPLLQLTGLLSSRMTRHLSIR